MYIYVCSLCACVYMTYTYTCTCACRYKVTCESTWPVYSGSAKKATELIARRHKIFEDVAFGNTKVFIRTPRTLTLLEQERAARIPQVVLIMQRVRPSHYCI